MSLRLQSRAKAAAERAGANAGAACNALVKGRRSPLPRRGGYLADVDQVSLPVTIDHAWATRAPGWDDESLYVNGAAICQACAGCDCR